MEGKLRRSASIRHVSKTRLPYIKPVLEVFGDVRDVTLGGSGAALESGPYGPDGCKLSGQANRNCLP